MRREPFLASLVGLLLTGGLISGCASTSKMMAPSPVGVWGYVIPNTPQGDAQGSIVVVSEGEAYSGTLYVDILDQTVPIEEVAFTDSTFSFKATLNANGERIGTDTRMTLSGDTMNGAMQVEGFGEFAITATRKEMDAGS